LELKAHIASPEFFAIEKQYLDNFAASPEAPTPDRRAGGVLVDGFWRGRQRGGSGGESVSNPD